MVNRYKFKYDGFGDCNCDIVMSNKGGYVEWEDYEKLQAELHALSTEYIKLLALHNNVRMPTK